jgi:nucleotide-binding universal stress UspA family protein
LWLSHAFLGGYDRGEAAVETDGDVAAHRAARSLERTAARVADHYPDLPVALVARCGTPVAVLGDLAIEAAVVVVGRHHRGRVAEAVLGSVAPGRLPSPSGPVVAVPTRLPYVARDACVCVGVTERGPSAAALDVAFQQASTHDMPLRLVRCVRDHREDGTHGAPVWDAVEAYQRAHPSVQVDVDVLVGEPGELLVKESLTAGLLVLGPGRGWGRRLGRLGPVSRDVLGSAACPVMLVRDSGPRSPVTASGSQGTHR